MTRIARKAADAESCFTGSQQLCDRILAQASGPAEVHAYAAGLVVRAVETVIPPGERALFLTHLARDLRARGRGHEADLARAAAARRLEPPSDELGLWLSHLTAVPTRGPGRSVWLGRHLHRALSHLGVGSALEGELARALAWHYLTAGAL